MILVSFLRGARSGPEKINGGGQQAKDPLRTPLQALTIPFNSILSFNLIYNQLCYPLHPLYATGTKEKGVSFLYMHAA